MSASVGQARFGVGGGGRGEVREQASGCSLSPWARAGYRDECVSMRVVLDRTLMGPVCATFSEKGREGERHRKHRLSSKVETNMETFASRIKLSSIPFFWTIISSYLIFFISRHMCIYV